MNGHIMGGKGKTSKDVNNICMLLHQPSRYKIVVFIDRQYVTA